MRDTVLVIDDQWSMQELARIVLQTAGYRVLVASDSATGLSLARLERPSVIVLDTRMPEMNGLELLTQLRQDPQTASIPVVLITNNPEKPQLAFRSRRGSIAYLRKPFRPPMLLMLIDRLLRQRKLPVTA